MPGADPVASVISVTSSKKQQKSRKSTNKRPPRGKREPSARSGLRTPRRNKNLSCKDTNDDILSCITQNDLTSESKAFTPAKAFRFVTIDEKTAQTKTEEEVEYPSFLDRHYKDIGPGIHDLKYTQKEYHTIIHDAQLVLSKEGTLVDVEPPCIIVGDIHGQFNDLINIFLVNGRPPETRYVFLVKGTKASGLVHIIVLLHVNRTLLVLLGDYVDRGAMSLSCIMLLLAYKVSYPDDVFILRGNHECARVNKKYGFHKECVEMIEKDGEEIWARFQRCFNMMPVSALVGTKILCMHGGLSPYLNSLDDLRKYPKPIRNPSRGVVNDLLWSDPDMAVPGYRTSTRGSGFAFGPSVIDDICDRLGVDLIVRAHQMCLDGYWACPSQKLLTIFSAPMYTNCYRNAGCVLSVDCELECQLVAMVPESRGVKDMVKQNKLWDLTVDNIEDN